jgi:hypothetical protein
MPGVPRELAEHALEVNKTARPITQKLWRFAKDRKQGIEVEVCKLLATGLRMCIDSTNLNKHCPKDPLPLPRIDQVVDLTADNVLLCFLDCYSGYH